MLGRIGSVPPSYQMTRSAVIVKMSQPERSSGDCHLPLELPLLSPSLSRSPTRISSSNAGMDILAKRAERMDRRHRSLVTSLMICMLSSFDTSPWPAREAPELILRLLSVGFIGRHYPICQGALPICMTPKECSSHRRMPVDIIFSP